MSKNPNYFSFPQLLLRINFSIGEARVCPISPRSFNAKISPNGCRQRGGGFTQAGGPQKFLRATHLNISTKLSAGIHPRLREAARWLQWLRTALSFSFLRGKVFYSSVIISLFFSFNFFIASRSSSIIPFCGVGKSSGITPPSRIIASLTSFPTVK